MRRAPNGIRCANERQRAGTQVAAPVGMSPTPVHVEVASPVRFDRTTLLVRILLAIVLGWLGITGGWLIAVLFLVLPLIAAISILAIGTDRFRTDVAPPVTRALVWLLQLSAFMLLLTDKFPGPGSDVRVDLPFQGRPSATTALFRMITSIPSGFVLAIVWLVSSVLWVIAALIVVVGVTMPRSLLAFQRGVLRWQARLVAYHASFVDDYPPFALDTGDLDQAELVATGAP
jgi:hypothetical protein